ncbi:MAG: 2-C-methyl-D-erythritol 4-phosphate cytidylyltransferase [Clostridia bacterium]|nr:2-C-methyl-D-erythritol 4-phosphate cytidylyltransferase [Clostridia bacterium]
MNICMIMSGGVGRRFGAPLPKQYVEILGRPVIDYVIEACRGASLTDNILIVADPSWWNYSEGMNSPGIDYADNGKERLDSVKSGFDFIAANYDPDEDTKVVIFDAVAPFVYPELIDSYFRALDDNDAIITCQKLTGALGNIYFEPLDRDKYYMTQSPEGFVFKKIYEVLDTTFPSQELAWQLGPDAKYSLNFDFKENLKLTYDYQLKEMEYRLKDRFGT